VETAIHQLMVRNEKMHDQLDTALGVFEDIEGALNNTSYDALSGALDRYGSDYTIVRWIRTTLNGRVSVANLHEFYMRLAIFRGCR